MNTPIVTCVYCGQQYPDGTPASGAEVLKQHIRVCAKHPMRELEDRHRLAISGLRCIVRKDCGTEQGRMAAAYLGQMGEALDG